MSFTLSVTESAALLIARSRGPIALDFVPPVS
jgi:hypothetical protein